MSMRKEIVILLGIEQVGGQVGSTVLISLQEECRVTHSVCLHRAINVQISIFRCLI